MVKWIVLLIFFLEMEGFDLCIHLNKYFPPPPNFDSVRGRPKSQVDSASPGRPAIFLRIDLQNRYAVRLGVRTLPVQGIRSTILSI
jgi:hypothetical protein